MGDQPTTETDTALTAKAVARDTSAFSEIARRWHSRVYLTALAITRDPDTADDIAQETFLRAWLKIDTLRDPALLLPWLSRITRNTAAAWMRAGQSRSRLLPLISMEEIPVEPPDNNNPSPRQNAARAEQDRQLADAVMQLPEDLRQVILLHYAEGMTASDIARMNGEAASTVTRRLDKARARLRDHLEAGISAGLATLKPTPRAVRRATVAIAAAIALPATTRAQLLHLAADTPPPPMPGAPAAATDPSTPAAHTAASIKETGTMKSIIANLSATKLLATAAAITVIGGGAYTVNSLTQADENARSGTEISSNANAFETGKAGVRTGTKVIALSGGERGSNNDTNGAVYRDRHNLSTATETIGEKLRPAERLALLEADLVSTHPQLVIEDGETSGKVYFNIEVVDASGLSIEGATIEKTGLRTFVNPETWYGGPGYEPKVQTNARGIARAYVPQYVKEKMKTGGLTFNVSHPDYTSTHHDMRLSSITKVVLKPGDVLKVIASDEKSSAPILSGIVPEFSGRFKPDWHQREDGTISIRKISGRKLAFYLKHTDGAGNVTVSDYNTIIFPWTSDKPLYVTMHPTYTVSGSLSPNVPRPVNNGKVVAHHVAGNRAYGQYVRQEVDIKPDGTFILSELPAGKIQIWAIADGWCSVIPEGIKTPYERPQKFILQRDNQPYVLPMNPTATAILTLVDSDGNPVEGVRVASSPNMCSEGSCGYWIRDDFSAKTDESGIAVIPDIPPLSKSRFTAMGEWQFSPRESDSGEFARNVVFDLAPGQTLEKTLTVYPEGTTVITQDGDRITTAPGSLAGQ